MKEIGGYLEYEENSSEMLYSDAKIGRAHV